MPTDLSAAWGEDVPYGPAPKPVSARVVEGDASSSQEGDVVRALLAELAELRREQQRRDTTLVIAACLLAAALMSYLDRLHSHLRRLGVPR